jgi:anti-sigma factor RsiW
MDNDRYMTCEQLADALDDYLEEHGSASARAAVEAHLAQCPTCPALVADVRALRAAARTLEPIEPPAHVWRQVQARLTADAPSRVSLLNRLALPFGAWRTLQPLGAVAGLVLVVSSLTWVGMRLAVAPANVAGGAGVPAEFQLAEAEYTDAIARLQEAADDAGPRLDALTSATLESSIDDIDLAIGEAREALAREPLDTLSQESLLEALGSKVALLQDTVALAAEVEPGTEEQNP